MSMSRKFQSLVSLVSFNWIFFGTFYLFCVTIRDWWLIAYSLNFDSLLNRFWDLSSTVDIERKHFWHFNYPAINSLGKMCALYWVRIGWERNKEWKFKFRVASSLPHLVVVSSRKRNWNLFFRVSSAHCSLVVWRYFFHCCTACDEQQDHCEESRDNLYWPTFKFSLTLITLIINQQQINLWILLPLFSSCARVFR